MIGNARFASSRRGIVYVGCSKKTHIAYVGQTSGSGGLITRWAQHLGVTTSSFWRRVEERGDCSADNISDLMIFAVELGEESLWNGVESSYREAVEYLVQVAIRQFCGDLVPYLRVISHVRANETCSLGFVRERAEGVVADFFDWYSSLSASSENSGIVA